MNDGGLQDTRRRERSPDNAVGRDALTTAARTNAEGRDMDAYLGHVARLHGCRSEQEIVSA